MTSNTSADEVFEYTGEGQSIPKDVISVRFHPSVVVVGNAAFSNRRQLGKVVLNEGLTRIGDFAFHGCPSLESITIPSSVAEICRYAFMDCSNLRVVVMSEKIHSIRSCSFNACHSLEMFKFPSLSTRLNNIIQTGYSEVENKIDEVRGLIERRGNEIFLYGAALRMGGLWDTIKPQLLNRIVSWIRYYEMKEATTLFELALWKAKMGQVEVNNINREACRLEVPGPVKDTILQYLS